MKRYLSLGALAAVCLALLVPDAHAQGVKMVTTLSGNYKIPLLAGTSGVSQQTKLSTLAAFLAGSSSGLNSLALNGTTSGVVTVNPGAAAAGTFNFNLPVTAGASGDILLSGGGSTTAMSWLTPAAGVAAWLADPTSAKLATAVTNETGSGLLVFGTAPTISAPVLSGHPTVTGSAPALTSCGTSPAIVGSDLAGQVTMGTGSPTGCVITFASAFTSAPFCTVTWQATPLASQSYAVSTTAITLTQTGTSSNVVNYTCIARSGG